MYVVLLCQGSLLYSYAHVPLVFIKRFWEKLFSTDVVETGIESLIVAISKGGARFDPRGQVPPQNEPQIYHHSSILCTPIHYNGCLGCIFLTLAVELGQV